MTRFIRSALFQGLAAAWLAMLLLPGSAAAADPWSLCPQAVRQVEARLGLPNHLLSAISRVESGRWNGRGREKSAWPWTVMAEGKGRYLPTKAAAIAEVEALRARGVRNIDVGCMQVNLRHHAKAFASLEEAFDPLANAGYAGRFLASLRTQWGSWTRAIGNYHSNTPRFSGPYRRKVFRAWREARHEANRARRAALNAKRASPAKLRKGADAAPAPGAILSARDLPHHARLY